LSPLYSTHPQPLFLLTPPTTCSRLTLFTTISVASTLVSPPQSLPVPPFVIAGGGRKTPTTPPRGAPKRKHEDIAEQTPAVISPALVAEQQPSRKASKTFHTAADAALPATPLSSNGNMDSDIEDFNSVASSDAFGEDAGSSLGGGKLAQSFARRGVAG
jgi:hypothetical protein